MDSRLRKKILISTACIHISFTLFLYVSHPPRIIKARKEPIQVRTIQPPTLLRLATEAAPSEKITEPPPREIVRTINKTLHTKPTKKKKAPPKKETSAKKSQKKIPKTAVKKTTDKTPLEIPSKEEQEYALQLLQLLESKLTLPEEGSVKLQITVQANGKLVKIEVLSSEHKMNEEYLMQALSEIEFPVHAFGKEETFSIEFRAEL